MARDRDSGDSPEIPSGGWKHIVCIGFLEHVGAHTDSIRPAAPEAHHIKLALVVHNGRYDQPQAT